MNTPISHSMRSLLAPSASNDRGHSLYALLTNGTNTYLNAPAGSGAIYFRSGNTDKL